ncbi:hypothetical protein [Comamonas humi]
MNEPTPIQVQCASAEIEAALAALGRTEDVRFSPSGRRVALVEFKANLIWVFELGDSPQEGPERMLITQLTRLESPDLLYPHGLCWLDEERIVVANRGDAVEVFAMPRPSGEPAVHRVSGRSLQTLALGLEEGTSSPGSVALRPLGQGRHELIVCHNYVNLLSHHIIGGPDAAGRHWYSGPAILLRQQLDIPDGVALSPDGHWIAISNHGTSEVLIYENTPDLTPESPPVGVLQGTHYPHGLCFTPDSRTLLVADAGQPFLHLFHADSQGWRGPRPTSQRVQVVERQAYERDHVNAAEGGPKGLDIRADGLLALTCKARPLAFCRLPELDATVASAATSDTVPMPQALVMAFVERHLKTGLATAELLQAQREATVAVLKNSWSWRLTAGLRWLGSVMERRAP